MDKVEIKTKSGFECELDQDAMDDMELAELLESIIDEQADSTKKMHAMTHIVEKILGADGKKALYDHCRNEVGRVPTTRVYGEITEIIQGMGSKKN